MKAEVEAVTEAIHGNGRALLRQSGTEPVVRIMIEANDQKQCEAYAAQIETVIAERGHTLG